LTAAHVEIGLRCRSFDKLYAAYHDCTTNLGLRYWMIELCCTDCRSLCWLGTQCSSFVKICVSQSQRRAANNFVGDETKPFVRDGNRQQLVASLIMFISWCIGGRPVLEQPASSVLPRMSPMNEVLAFVGARRTVTWLGQFGGPTPKPTQLWHCDPVHGKLRRRRPSRALDTLVIRWGKHFRGKTGPMKKSQEYPRMFCQAVALLWSQPSCPASSRGGGFLGHAA